MTAPGDRDPRGTLDPGSVFTGEYAVDREIAEGGMGTVYEVVQRNTGQRRALKVLHRWLADDAKVRQHFINEARISTRIDSEHVVQVIDAGVVMPGAVPWYVMELLSGETLEAAVRRRGAFSPAETLEVFEQLGHGVGAAHRVGIVHCDLKPENVFIAAARRVDAHFIVKVLDFGIAHVLPSLKASVQLSSPQGSPGWLAPEQIKPDGRVTTTTDVWALGLIAFYLLTGGSYWRWFDRFPAIVAEIEASPLEPASVRAASLMRPHAPPAGFDDWFARCVDRDPERRFDNASEAVEALRAVLTPAPRASQAAPPAEPSSADAEGASRVRMLLLALNEAERRGEVEARVRIGEELVARGCRDAGVAQRTASAHVARAWTLEQHGSRALALDDARKAVALDAGSPQAHYLLGVLLLRARLFVEALASLDLAVKLNPDAIGFVRERGRVLQILGRHHEALFDRRRVIELDPTRADAWVARAMTHLALRDFESAESDLTSAIEREPGSVGALKARASVRAERGAWLDVLTDLDEVMERAPDDPALWWERCRAMRALGDPVAALVSLRRAAELGHAVAAEELRTLDVR